MKLQGFLDFIKGVLSDNGSPSSSRVYMLGMGTAMASLLAAIFHHLFKLTDPVVIAAYMGNMPMVLGGMTALVGAPYTVNQGGNVLSGLLEKLRGKKDGDGQ